MSQHIDKISVKISGKGSNLNVQGFELTVAVNSIPSIVIEALPISQSGKGTKASTPKFSEITQLYDELSKDAASLKSTASITISITSSGKGSSCAQSITLKDWVLSDVGLSSVTNYSAPTLTVIYRHPVIELDHVGPIYEEVLNRNELNNTFLNIGGSDVIGIMDDIYSKYANENPIEFFELASLAHGGPEGNQRSKVQQARSDLANYLPSSRIQCTGGLFLGSSAGAALKFIKAAIAATVAPQPFGNSAWVTIIRTICPLLVREVVPTYDAEKLKLEPFNPWQKASLSLSSDKIESIDVASMDTDPIYGLATRKNADRTEFVTDGNVRSAITSKDKPENCSFAFYFPVGKDIENAVGRIEYYGGNAILDAARSFDFGAYNTDGKLNKNEDKLTDKLEEELLAKVAQATFQAKYRKYCKAAVTTMPMFTDASGSVIYPGRVVEIKDSNSGKMIHGYLSRLTVKGTASGGGMSYYEMMYARSSDAGSNLLVDEGAKNPCYSG